MRAYLVGGPADGRVIDHMPEGQTIYRVPIPREPSIREYLQAAMNPLDARPNHHVADYQFTGLATVDSRGQVIGVIYEFQRMEPA